MFRPIGKFASRILFAAALGLVVLWAAPAYAADLSADEIKAKIIDKTLKWQASAGPRGVTKYSPDGTAILSNSTISGISSDSGKWRLDGDKICVVWKLVRNGQEGCFTVSAADGGKFKTSTNIVMTAE